MKNVLRLTEGAGTTFERRLLESALEDASSPGSMSRVAARLGLELPATQLQGSSQEDGSVAAEAGLKKASSGALLKYTLIAIVCGSSGGSTLSNAALSNAALSNAALSDAAPLDAALLVSVPMVAESRELSRSEFISDAVALRAEEAKPQLPAPVQSVPVARPALRRVPAQLPSPSAREPSSGTSAPSADGLLAEVQQLDRVRAALAAFQSQAALAELDAYDQRFPRGELALEAIVLRVQALRSAGQFAPATRLARHALELPGIERYRARLTRLIDSE